MSMYYFY